MKLTVTDQRLTHYSHLTDLGVLRLSAGKGTNRMQVVMDLGSQAVLVKNCMGKIYRIEVNS